ncbi:hypothetical protein KY358_05335 [Candidatus Woesearchaeota archaeon]|nr:hypothetical protein [Candidatus Woesearchaeota archaeon]
MNKKIFLEIALSRIPCLLSLQDKNPFSPTYGSFDREYWQYKKVDTPYASVQGAVFSLALLYKNKLQDNPYYKNKRVLEWAIAGLKFLPKIQKRNGSFDEYYPNEKSYIGTALTLYPCAEAFNLIKDEIEEKDKKTIISSLKKAAYFLAENTEPLVINQEMMAALSIYCVNQTLKKEKLKKSFEKKLSFVLKSQTKEGWFPEYEGCDVGYLSYTIDFLATYFKKSKDKRVIEPLNKAIEFISYLIHPNGTAGGEYTARNTEYLVPHGFEITGNLNPLSKSIAEFIAKSLDRDNMTSPKNMDNRYTPLYVHQYIQTFLEHTKNTEKKPLPFERGEFTKYFRDAGILITKRGKKYIIIGAKKGGVIRVYDLKNNEIEFSSCGYIIKNKNRVSSSTYLDNKREITIKENRIIIKGMFYDVVWIKSSPLKHISLRIILFSGAISGFVRELIKKILITRKKLNRVRFIREISFNKDKMTIEDKIKSKKAVQAWSIDKFAFRYIPSSRFFQKQELKTEGTIFKGHQKRFKSTQTIRL